MATVQNFTQWHEVRDFIVRVVLAPFMSPPRGHLDITPRVVCTLCKARQINIVGAAATALPLNGVPASKGVVIPCGHMFCADCWDILNLQQAGAGQPYSCPTCLNIPRYNWCGCAVPAFPIPTNELAHVAATALDSVPLTSPEGNSGLNGTYAMCKPCLESNMEYVIPAIIDAATANFVPGTNDMELFRAKVSDFAKTFSVVGWASWDCKECKANRSSCRFFVKIPPMNATLQIITHLFEDDRRVEVRTLADHEILLEVGNPDFIHQIM
ncbi:hypothetical protein QBC34DRAFT_122397 [Podospora aff. communis PSN243]|uniref:RING-type domain-containing protein n=1 Tax=Podospora aff. communis PSN243 TaxID=3040156 RepID=A0AAV9GGR6_9PEZI|nr:hypothetical protein QBC34DRAFT_122397 [Podospora aff. communis PSN243]